MYAERGFTLVEVILTIVVISIVAVGLLSAQAVIIGRSADPMISRQSIAIAEGYLNEILAKDFLDPNTATTCPAAPATRSLYDNVCDYDGLSGAVTDQFGNGMGLTGYSASVEISASSGLNNLSSNDALLATVTVTDPIGHRTVLSGYRTRY